MSSIHKNKHLSKMMDPNGNFKIVAIDHRAVYIGQLEKMGVLNANAECMAKSKNKIISQFNDLASAFLLDPAHVLYGECDEDIIKKHGLLIGIEGNDYSSTEFNDKYLTDIIDVKGISQNGGDCVKLFIYYYDDEPIRKKLIQLVKKVSADCDTYGITFLLEPILAPEYSKLATLEQVALNKKMVESFNHMGVDIFKIIFPSSLSEYSDDELVTHVQSVTENIDVPFILLSSGVSVEQFERQLSIFTKAGGKGFAVGRTLWENCVNPEHANIEQYNKEMVEKFKSFSNIISTCKD